MIRSIIVFFIFISVSFGFEVGSKVEKELLDKIGASKQVVVVDFFASWCVSCKKELPLIDKLSQEMKDVEFIGIDSDEKKEDGLEFQKSLNLSFHVYNDNSQEVIKKFDPIGVPAVYVLKDGIVKKVHFGALDDIDKVIQKDLAELK